MPWIRECSNARILSSSCIMHARVQSLWFLLIIDKAEINWPSGSVVVSVNLLEGKLQVQSPAAKAKRRCYTINERKEYMQETQHTQQTATKIAKIQDIVHWYKKTKQQTTQINKKKHALRERWEYRLGTVRDKCHFGVLTRFTALNLTLIPSVSYKTV